MKFIPTPNFNMNAEEQTLNDLNMKYNDIVSPDESASQYDNFNSNKGLLDIAAGGAAGGAGQQGGAAGAAGHAIESNGNQITLQNSGQTAGATS